WGPELKKCVNCGNARVFYFSVEAKGSLCKKCANGDKSGIDFAATYWQDVLSTIKKLSATPGNELDGLNIEPGIEKNVEEMISQYLLEYLPRPLKTNLFI
ncbi:MAG: DNA repair protein RecO C-terminal domain-containing protein, partial [Elusimicrobiota bacterium]